MTFKEELLNAPTFTREDADRTYHSLYIVPTDRISESSIYNELVLVAEYGRRKFVRFDKGSDLVQCCDNIGFRIDYHCGVMCLHMSRFKIEMAGLTFLIAFAEGERTT